VISAGRLELRDYADRPSVSRLEVKALEDALADECGLLLLVWPTAVLKRRLGSAVEYALLYTGILVLARLDKSSGKLSYELYYGGEKVAEGQCSAT
jgi:hypothetical protein